MKIQIEIIDQYKKYFREKLSTKTFDKKLTRNKPKSAPHFFNKFMSTGKILNVIAELTFLFNTYRGYAPLIVAGATDFLFSSEGTTQGDPLPMLFYGVSLMPLIESLKDRDKYLETWYADDSGALGALENLVEWLSS